MEILSYLRRRGIKAAIPERTTRSTAVSGGVGACARWTGWPTGAASTSARALTDKLATLHAAALAARNVLVVCYWHLGDGLATRTPHPLDDPLTNNPRQELRRARYSERGTPGVRREALRCIPDAVGMNSEGGSWVA